MPFVINEPVLSCCGLPRDKCRCRKVTEGATIKNNSLAYENHSIVSNQSNTLVANRSCCSNPHNLCPDCARAAGVVDNHDLLPLTHPTCVENDPSYFARGHHAGIKPPEEPAYQFRERTFEDLRLRNDPVPKAPPPYYDSQGTLTTNLPPVDKHNILPLPTIDWAAEARARRQK